jgi:hypothetical protein
VRMRCRHRALRLHRVPPRHHQTTANDLQISTPEVVNGAHAQAQVEAVIMHPLFTTFTFYSHIFFWELANSRKHQLQNDVA